MRGNGRTNRPFAIAIVGNASHGLRRPRATRTLQGACWSTCCDTLPKTSRPRVDRPYEPTTTKSVLKAAAPFASAQWTSSEGASADTNHSGNICRMRSAAPPAT